MPGNSVNQVCWFGVDEPAGLSLGMVASPQCLLRFARRHYCSAATNGGQLPDTPSSSSYPDGHIDDLAAQAMYSRMSSGPSWSVERWKYCANYTPTSREHGCERLSHDQPNRLFPTVNYWIDFARHVLAERGAIVRRAGERNRTQTGMM